MRANARQWLELADKVYHYRRDRLSAVELQDLQTQTSALHRLVRTKAERMKIKLAVESLEEVLRRLGGTHYPKSSLVENVEFFLVAAIVILGFRTYFIQPFKIPTNSMWPSYYGMTAEVLPPDAPAPGPIERTFRLLAFGARRHEVTAPRSGQVSAEFFENGSLAYTLKPGRKWFVLPATVREYTFYVDGEPASLTVPIDFHDVDQAMWETYFGDKESFLDYMQAQARNGHALQRRVMEINQSNGANQRVVRVPLNRKVAAGESLLRFDLLTGDQLFVDRMSYHFVRPSVGQGFVFRTGQIKSRFMTNRDTGRQLDEYYIKRLVGLPGDTLAIRDLTLFRNGRPITGSPAFDKNARQADRFVGYRNEQALGVGQTMTVPADQFMVLGDNSANSQDSRYWGYVPAKSVIGKPFLIYYPFTKRLGPAR